MKTRTRGFTLIELMIVVVIIGILVSIAVPNFVRMKINAQEAGVKSNSHAVQMAAEDFAVQNTGIYAGDTNDVIVTGETIVDLLPQNQPLPNPFTRAQTEPVDGPATNPGETGYEPVADGSGVNVGYIITGMGKTTQVCRFTNGT